MPAENNDHLIDECRRIEDDSKYCAEAHYIIAADAERVSFWVKFIPALAAAVSGIALLSGAPNWVAWFSVISGVAFAVESIIGPEKRREEHSQAGKSYTALKHESRSLYQTFYKEIDRKSFTVLVQILRERYNMIAKLTPPTTIDSFEKGRVRIKAGRHTPDFAELERESE